MEARRLTGRLVVLPVARDLVSHYATGIWAARAQLVAQKRGRVAQTGAASLVEFLVGVILHPSSRIVGIALLFVDRKRRAPLTHKDPTPARPSVTVSLSSQTRPSCALLLLLRCSRRD